VTVSLSWRTALHGITWLGAERDTLHFMELEVSLPCLQDPAIGPYSEQDASISFLPTVFA